VGNWSQCVRNFEKKTYTISNNSKDDDGYDYDDGGGDFEEDRNMGRVRSGDFSISFSFFFNFFFTCPYYSPLCIFPVIFYLLFA